MPTSNKKYPQKAREKRDTKTKWYKQQPIANYIAKFQYSNGDGLLTEVDNRKLNPFILQPAQLSALSIVIGRHLSKSTILWPMLHEVNIQPCRMVDNGK